MYHICLFVFFIYYYFSFFFFFCCFVFISIGSKVYLLTNDMQRNAARKEQVNQSVVLKRNTNTNKEANKLISSNVRIYSRHVSRKWFWLRFWSRKKKQIAPQSAPILQTWLLIYAFLYLDKFDKAKTWANRKGIPKEKRKKKNKIKMIKQKLGLIAIKFV